MFKFSRDRGKVIIAIDCGTTQGGVAYIYSRPKEPPKIVPVTEWPHHGKNPRVPTSIWYSSLNGDRRAHGATAHTSDIIEKAMERDWLTAQFFNLSFFPPNTISFPPLIPQGMTYDCVYADFFLYLLEQAKASFCHSESETTWNRLWEAHCFEFVIAYPTWCSSKARDVMREAVVKAKLVTSQEAQSKVHFINDRVAVRSFVMSKAVGGKPGDQYIVCSTDGFVVDTTLFTIEPNTQPRYQSFSASEYGSFVTTAAEKITTGNLSSKTLVDASVQDELVAECSHLAVDEILHANSTATHAKEIILMGRFAETDHLTQFLAPCLENKIPVVATIETANAVAVGAAWYVDGEHQPAESPGASDKQTGRLQHDLTKMMTRMTNMERNYEEETKKLKKEVDDARASYADLRRAVQVHDQYQSTDLISEFKKLNSSIDKACDTITDSIVNKKAKQTSLLAEGKLGTLVPRTLIHASITADLFVFTFLRIYISQALHASLALFHPRAAAAQEPIENCYKLIRQMEPQENGARWRSWTFLALERQHSPPGKAEVTSAAAAWAKEFESDVMESAIKPLLRIFSSNRPKDVKWQESLRSIATAAYLWNFKVKTRFFQYDFHPCIFRFDEPFNPQNMKRDGVSNLKDKGTAGNIIASVGMGLKTSIAKGMNREPEEFLQLQVPVVTAMDIRSD